MESLLARATQATASTQNQTTAGEAPAVDVGIGRRRTSPRRVGASEQSASADTCALAISLDAVRASAIVVERVAGKPRVVAVGRALVSSFSAGSDASAGARAALTQMESALGRSLYSMGAVTTKNNALACDARPAVALVHFRDKPGLAAAMRALASLDAIVGEPIEVTAATDCKSLADRLRSAAPSSTRHARPTAVVVVGPADAPALGQLAEAMALAYPVVAAAPAVIWAGAAAGGPLARGVLSPRCQLRVVDPVRPKPEVEHPEPLRREIAELWRDDVDERLPGASAVAGWLGIGPAPVRLAEERALACLAAERNQPVWYARVDSAGAVLLRAEPGLKARLTAGRSSQRSSAPRPWFLSDSAAAADRAVEHAVEALRSAAAAMPSDQRPSANRGGGLLIAAGDLLHLDAGRLVHVLSDALAPRGAVQLATDDADAVRLLGGLMPDAPDLAAAALPDALRPMGAMLAPGWSGSPGRPVFEAVGRGVLVADETRRIPLAEPESATITARRPGWWDPRRYFGLRPTLQAQGGPIGLILDGRARPTTTVALSLGREPIVDDAGAPEILAGPTPIRGIGSNPVVIRRSRAMPPGSRVLVSAGEKVTADEVIAIAPQGDGSEAAIVAAGPMLGVADPRPFLVRAAGTTVAAGDVIAERSHLFGLIKRRVVAPVAGRVALGLGGFGNLAIVPSEEGSGIAAHRPGVIVATLSDDQVVIETRGIQIGGALGFGHEARGKLAMTPAQGAIAVVDVLDEATLRALRSVSAAGAIVGSVDPAVHDELDRSGFPVVAIEGFGRAPLSERARATLTQHAGQVACLSPGQAESGREWPEIIVPVEDSAARALSELVLAPGAQVRVLGETPAFGTVVGVPATPRRLGSGVVAATAVVEVADGERRHVPFTNLELLG